jgi:serine/threonine protein kinase
VEVDGGLHRHRQIAGRYRLDDLLGSGAVADVFRAHDELLGRTVAVKMFRPATVDPELARRTTKETRLLAGMSHPNLVRVFDAGTGEFGLDDSREFIVLELVEGSSLSATMSGGPIPSAAVERIGAQVADALAYTHAQRVIHRDVKPANILVSGSGDGVVKLTDFGIALTLDATRQTREGFTVGTPQFFSPEQVCGQRIGPPTDVYALGLTLREALTGQPAYQGNPIELALARLARPPEFPSWLEPRWVSLLSEMTALDPDRRPTAGDVAQRLQNLHEHDGRAVLNPLASLAVMDPRAQATTGVFPNSVTSSIAASTTRERSRLVRVPLIAAAAVVIAGAGAAGIEALSAGSSLAGSGSGAAASTPSATHTPSMAPAKVSHQPSRPTPVSRARSSGGTGGVAQVVDVSNNSKNAAPAKKAAPPRPAKKAPPPPPAA